MSLPSTACGTFAMKAISPGVRRLRNRPTSGRDPGAVRAGGSGCEDRRRRSSGLGAAWLLAGSTPRARHLGAGLNNRGEPLDRRREGSKRVLRLKKSNRYTGSSLECVVRKVDAVNPRESLEEFALQRFIVEGWPSRQTFELHLDLAVGPHVERRPDVRGTVFPGMNGDSHSSVESSTQPPYAVFP